MESLSDFKGYEKDNNNDNDINRDIINVMLLYESENYDCILFKGKMLEGKFHGKDIV